MRRLGVTGGIGSGKSFVCSVLRDVFLLPVYDCDAEAKRLMRVAPSIKKMLKDLVGSNVYGTDGTLNKAALAEYLFSSDGNAASVNAVVHPMVRYDFRSWCERQKTEVVCMESAILCESGFDSEVDEILFIDAPSEMRIARAMQRSRFSREEIERRMSRQNVTLARSKAHHIIYNGENATKESITNQIKESILC